MVRAAIAKLDFRAHRFEQFAFSLNIANVGDILQNYWFFGQDSGGHRGQRSILRSTYSNGSNQGIATTDDEFVHLNESLN
jgi:hypothetical protein